MSTPFINMDKHLRKIQIYATRLSFFECRNQAAITWIIHSMLEVLSQEVFSFYSNNENAVGSFHMELRQLLLAHLSTKCSWWAIVVSGCPSSVVVRRASSVVRRPSSVNIWCLHSRGHICDPILIKLWQNVCFDNI